MLDIISCSLRVKSLLRKVKVLLAAHLIKFCVIRIKEICGCFIIRLLASWHPAWIQMWFDNLLLAYWLLSILKTLFSYFFLSFLPCNCRIIKVFKPCNFELLHYLYLKVPVHPPQLVKSSFIRYILSYIYVCICICFHEKKHAQTLQQAFCRRLLVHIPLNS